VLLRACVYNRWQVEGLLALIRDRLIESNPFAVAAGDSADPERREMFSTFMSKLDQVRQSCFHRIRRPISMS
jgi:hypothetical protein